MVKMMVLHSPGGSESVRGGLIRAFNGSGLEAAFWSPKRKSAFDAFATYSPSVFYGTTYDFDTAQERCVRARPELKVVMFASAWGPLADSLPQDEFPIVRVTDAEKRRLEALKRATGKPDFVLIHASESYLEGVLGGWRSIGIEPISCLNAADGYLYRPTEPRPEFVCDAAICGGRWPFKSRNLDPFILPLCEPDTGLDVKIWGYGGWENTTPRYLGRLSLEEEVALYSSAKVCLNISEPHATDARYGSDLVERLFKTAACGACVVSDYVEEGREVFEGHLPMARTPAEYADLLRFYLDNQDMAREVGRRLREVVLRKHTYHARAATLLSALGLQKEADQCLMALKELINSQPTT